MSKICNKCHIEKKDSEFRVRKKNGKTYLYSYCKECEKAERKIDREHQREYSKKHYQNNKKVYNERSKKYYENNKEKIKNIQNTKYGSEYRKEWRKNNPDKVKEYIKKDSEKRKNEPFRKFKEHARDTIRNAFRRKGYSKDTKTEKLLGCEYIVFINHLLQTYKKNYGEEYDFKEKVHIDHIIPLATAKTKKDLVKLSHYTNLQLLKEKDNLRKGAKTEYSL